jgi:hypothetical protein
VRDERKGYGIGSGKMYAGHLGRGGLVRSSTADDPQDIADVELAFGAAPEGAEIEKESAAPERAKARPVAGAYPTDKGGGFR